MKIINSCIKPKRTGRPVQKFFLKESLKGNILLMTVEGHKNAMVLDKDGFYKDWIHNPQFKHSIMDEGATIIEDESRLMACYKFKDLLDAKRKAGLKKHP